MRNVRLATCILLALALCSPALFASGFENSGLGTTAMGMGGAYRAVANDWTAAYYNPAGYAFVLDNQLGANLGLMHYRHEITPDYVARDDYDNEYGWGIVNGQTINNFHRILNNPSGGFLVRMPVWGETVFGLSAYQPFDHSIAWRLYNPAAANFRSYNSEAADLMPKDHYKNDLDVVAFQLSMAHEFKDGKLALGIGLQVLRGDLWYSNLYFRQNPRVDPSATGLDIDRRPYDRIPEFTKNVGRGWSFGVRAGMLWKATEKLNVALTAYLPFDMTIKGDTYYTFIMPEHQSQGINYANETLEDVEFMVGGSRELVSDFEVDLQLPASFGVGFAFKPMEKLTVSLDAEYTLWSQFEGLEFLYSNHSGTPQYTDQNTFEVVKIEEDWFTSDLSNPVEWDNSAKVMFGLMYDASETITLLGGASMDQSPARNSNEWTPQFVDTGNKFGINGGTIFHINRWDVGIVTSYYSHPDETVVGLTDLNNDGLYDNVPGDYSASYYETVLSFGYRF